MSRVKLPSLGDLNDSLDSEQAVQIPKTTAYHTNFNRVLMKRMKKIWKDYIEFNDNRVVFKKKDVLLKKDQDTWTDILKLIEPLHWKDQTKLILIIRKKLNPPSDTFLKEIGSSIINNLTSLRFFELSIEQSAILRDQDFISRGIQIGRNLTNLCHLKLIFWRCMRITNDGLKILGSEITSHLLNLDSFELLFHSSYRINEKGLTCLASQICRHLHKLQSLSLSFCDCGSITDSALEALTSKIRRINLKQLTLNFSYCPKVSSEALESISLNIFRYFSSGTYLKLEFNNCREINDDSVTMLFSNILQPMMHLNHLILDFGKCGKITDSSLQITAEEIAVKFPNLQHLVLNFSGSAITGNGLEALGLHFSNAKLKLQRLKLVLVGCSELSFKYEGKLRQMLAFIPILNIYTKSSYISMT